MVSGNRYNRIFGENKYADELLRIINLKRTDICRFRDIFTSKNGQYIVVYTRTGGVFRKYYDEFYQQLGMHPLIVHACDDKLDTTYHYITFTVPPADRERTEDIFAEQGEVESISKKFNAIEREAATMNLEQMRNDPRFADDIKLVEEAARTGRMIVAQDDDVPAGYDILKEGIKFKL
jgi:hypothetical protein